jgi:hypothetical protein
MSFVNEGAGQMREQTEKDPQPLVFKSKAAGPPWTLVGVSVLFLLVLSLVIAKNFAGKSDPQPAETPKHIPAAQSSSEIVTPAPPSPSPSAKVGWIQTAKLRGNGVSLQEFLDSLAANKSAEKKKKSEVVRLCEYQGNDEISVDEALGLLNCVRFPARLTEKAVELSGMDSQERAWRLLAARTGIEDRTWGALQPWQQLRLKCEQSLSEFLGTPGIESDTALLDRLAWMVEGSDRAITIGRDGFIEEKILKWNAVTEIHAAQDILLKAAESTSAPVRAAAALGLGKTLALTRIAQIPGTDPVIQSLQKLLNDRDTEVADSAALAFGNSAAVSGMQCLVQRLAMAEHQQTLSDVLTALCRAEQIGRNLTPEIMGAEKWELRRQLMEQMRVWTTTCLPQLDPAQFDLLTTAAALRTLEVFSPLPEKNPFSEALCDRLEKSNQPRAMDVAAEFRSRWNKEILQRSAMAKSLSDVAGPQWHNYRFSISHALTLMSNNERVNSQAALWRLSRPEGISFDPEFDQDALKQVTDRAVALAKASQYVTLRRWALEALYCEHPQENNNHEKSVWRLNSDPEIALQVFVNERDPDLQLAAANALGRFAGPGEVDRLTGCINSRATVAVEKLVRQLVQRSSAEATGESYSPPLANLIEQLANSTDPGLSSLAAWAKVNDPGVDLSHRVRLVHSFNAPGQRVSAVRALSERSDRRFLQPEMLKALLSDKSAEVRVTVFDCGLPDAISSAPENARLVLLGLSDSDETVQLAALKFRARSRTELRQELKAKLAELSASGTPQVRTAAASLLNR